jgi:hypothetical protein
LKLIVNRKKRKLNKRELQKSSKKPKRKGFVLKKRRKPSSMFLKISLKLLQNVT